MVERSLESRPVNERPQWKQRQGSRQQQARQPDVEFPPGVKRHSRTNSLERLSELPVVKRYECVRNHSEASTNSARVTRSSLAKSLAMLTSIEKEGEEEYACVLYSVGDLLTSFESAMESSDARMWKEACDSEFESLKK